MIVYDRVEPEGRCVSPDGHDYVEDIRFCDVIPTSITCPRCGKAWGIVASEVSDEGMADPLADTVGLTVGHSHQPDADSRPDASSV